MHFLGKIGQIILWYPPQGLTSPDLGNPESTTDHLIESLPYIQLCNLKQSTFKMATLWVINSLFGTNKRLPHWLPRTTVWVSFWTIIGDKHVCFPRNQDKHIYFYCELKILKNCLTMALYCLITVLFNVLYLGMSLGYSDIGKDKKCEQQFQVCLKCNDFLPETH